MQFEKIRSVKKVGMGRTVDIEVNHPKHIFYGNGIATSNSHAVSYAFNAYTYPQSYQEVKIPFPQTLFNFNLHSALLLGIFAVHFS